MQINNRLFVSFVNKITLLKTILIIRGQIEKLMFICKELIRQFYMKVEIE